jgi:3-oxoacyl-[acyl-carrier protein] reductase
MVTYMRFDGRVAVVTGASRGIGRAIALALAKEGCNVVVGYEKNRQKAQEVVQTAIDSRVRAVSTKCDVSLRTDVELMFKVAVKEFEKVDILVNNAGIDCGGRLMDTTDEIWDRTMDVNLKGVFLCTQVGARYMIPKRYGKIVNISANSGFGISVTGETAYAVAKAGVIQLTKTAALELGEFGINVNCVAPGAVNTEMLKGNMTESEYSKLIEGRKKITSLGLIGEPDDIASVVLFFASDESRFVTGKTLLVDGGRRDFL